MVLDLVETEMPDRYQLKLNSREVHGEVQRGNDRPQLSMQTKKCRPDGHRAVSRSATPRHRPRVSKEPVCCISRRSTRKPELETFSRR